MHKKVIKKIHKSVNMRWQKIRKAFCKICRGSHRDLSRGHPSGLNVVCCHSDAIALRRGDLICATCSRWAVLIISCEQEHSLKAPYPTTTPSPQSSPPPSSCFKPPFPAPSIQVHRNLPLFTSVRPPSLISTMSPSRTAAPSATPIHTSGNIQLSCPYCGFSTRVVSLKSEGSSPTLLDYQTHQNFKYGLLFPLSIGFPPCIRQLR